MSANRITDVAGVLVGQAQDERQATGVTLVLFEEPAIASVAILGGAPGVRDTALLEPEMTVERVDALLLSGGSAYGLDAAGGVMAALAARGRGFPVGSVRVPIVPQAILFDLLNGGDRPWLVSPLLFETPYRALGIAAVEAAGIEITLGSAGAGHGATTANLKGGIGTASAVSSGGHRVGAIVAVNALGSATVGDGPHFWAATSERGAEFGGLGLPDPLPAGAHALQMKGGLAPQAGANTTIAVVATDAALTKAQCKRLALAAHDGLGRALRPAHGAFDGDVVFAAATGAVAGAPDPTALTELGALAAECLARAVARGVYEATALPFAGALPAWRDRFGPA